MTKLVIGASVALKWVVPEQGYAEAVRLRTLAAMAAPDLIVAECANVLWKKAARGELTPAEAVMAARLLQRADIDIYPTRNLLDCATKLAIDLNRPAYDCICVTLAATNGWPLVTADERLLRTVGATGAALQVAYSIQDALRFALKNS